MFCVKIAATSANIGSGFDSLGLALSLYNTVLAEEWEDVVITAAPGIKTDKRNLIYWTAESLYNECGKTLKGMRITEKPCIPSTRGLGSSSACIVAALLLANAMLKNPLSDSELLDRATAIEGHPDNVAPALLGGFVTGVFEDGHLFYHCKPISEILCFIAFVPSFELSTKKARAVLPKSLPFKDAVYNIGRAALATAAFCEGRYDLLEVATRDKIQQQYRLPLISGGNEIFDICAEAGAKSVYISGAGPTIMAVVTKADTEKFLSAADTALRKNPLISEYKILNLSPSNEKPFVVEI